MLNARSQKSRGASQSTRARVESWWEKPGFALETDMRLALDPDSVVAGLAFILADGKPYTQIGCSAVVHPQYEDDALLWDWLTSWSLRRAAELVPLAALGLRVAATCAALPEDWAHCAALERAGLTPVRVESHMRIDLNSPAPIAQWPDGISVRIADLDADVDVIVATYLEAMRDHWGYVERPRAEVLGSFVSEIESRCGPMDPTLCFLAIAGAEIVGVSLCIDGLPDDPTGGYVYELCIRPAWRKRGIALALLHHAFAEFCRRGRTAVELDVDSESLTGALRLYERAGMRAVQQSVTYEKELRPGIDLATRELSA
jgi:ribosomal protein S18 acetylase RimI-like enzyme